MADVVTLFVFSCTYTMSLFAFHTTTWFLVMLTLVLVCILTVRANPIQQSQ